MMFDLLILFTPFFTKFLPVYLKTIHNQISAMFNHAVRFYGLPENPAAIAGNMGKEKAGDVLVWTKEEYLQFIETLKDKPASYYAFETLYWCGLRLGEMLALTPADFDFERKIIHVTKSFQRISGEDVITPPKTEKGIRRVLMPDFYADKMQAYVGVSFCGNAIIDGMTVADFIRRFEIEKVVATDTAEDVARKLSEHYKDNATHFFVCGYNSDIPYVFDVLDGYSRRNISPIARKIISPKDAAIEKEVKSQDVGAPANLSNDGVEEKESVELQTVEFSALWAGKKTAITKIVNNPPILNADWATMPLKDAIDFAEFLIDTTIKYERFCDDIQTCGGDIDILVITKDEAFWKQHKIYCPNR